MIESREIEAKAEELGVHIANVQRDYVFGWLLAGLYDPANALGGQLIVKGGNAFRKAYFENARFSNDLDFSTLTALDEHALRVGLGQACEYAGAASGVEFFVEETRVKELNHAADDSSMFEARVYFKSFYAEEDLTIKVELDVKEFDRLILPIQRRNVIHSYSDAAACQGVIQCWKLEELLAAKLKALLQRQHSPDLFDFVYSVFFQNALAVNRSEVITAFLKKTIYEPSPFLARRLLLDLPFEVIRGLWQRYLVIPRVSEIDFDAAAARFREGIGGFFDLIALPAHPAFAGGGGGAAVYHYTSDQRSTILEAARLQRLLSLTYDGYRRTVEPYSLVYKRRQDGIAREYFYVYDQTGGRSGKPGLKSFGLKRFMTSGLRMEPTSRGTQWTL